MKYVKFLIAFLFSLAITAALAGVPYCAWAAKCEFLPAMLALNAGILALWTLLAVLFGRIYCETACPLGFVQDIVRLIFRKRVRRVCARLPESAARRSVRWGVFALFLLGGIFGPGFALLDPYALYSRAVLAFLPTERAPDAIFAAVAFGSLALVLITAACGKGRFWCNWICPVGTFLDCFRPLVRFKTKVAVCDGCSRCRACFPKMPAAPQNQQTPTATPPTATATTRREFLATGTVAVAAVADKFTDGGLSPVSLPGIPDRETPLVPAGAHSLKAFSAHCVGCGLCIRACTFHVLRPDTSLKRFLLPEMGFERGWCRPGCHACADVCPAGAISPLSEEEKRHTHIGVAAFHADRCLAATEGVSCTTCVRHCPVKAIKLVAANGRQIPTANREACIGCGACENLCPVRPLAAITVSGFERHRETRPMAERDVIAEVRALFDAGKASAALVKGGVILATEKGRGVLPLLNLYDQRPDLFRGAFVIDKVIGRAAAAVCVKGGAVRVYGVVVSEEAKSFLEQNGISVAAGTFVPRILDRVRKDSCPLERAVSGLTDPDEMIAAERAFKPPR